MVRLSLLVSFPKPGTHPQSHWTQDRTDIRTVVSDKWVFSFAKLFVQNVIAPPSPPNLFLLISVSTTGCYQVVISKYSVLISGQATGKGKEGGCLGSLINEVFPSITVNKLE